MNTRAGYAPLHCRSYFSLLRGVLSPEELCAAARRMGAKAAGIADVNGFYGLPRFAAAAQEQGLKALYGTALYRGEQHLCTLLCSTPEGFARANTLLTRFTAAERGQEEWEGYDPVEDLVLEGWPGLRVLSADPGVLRRLARRDTRRLYAGLAYGRPFDHLRRLAQELGLSLFAYNDAVYLQEGQGELYRVLRAIGRNRPLTAMPVGGGLDGSHRMADPAEVERFFAAVPEALEEAQRHAREAEGFTLPRPLLFPAFRGLDEQQAYRRLRQLCMEGARRRYGLDLRRDAAAGADRVRRRLFYELSIIRDKGFSSYFLVVHDIVSRFPRTCGRGSSAASIVSYLLGITHVEPLRYRLYFERFLNPGRKDPPDIDVDFPWDEREQALAYVFRTYPGRAGMVADHVTFGPRSALREPARVMGYEKQDIDRFAALWRRGERAALPERLRRAAAGLFGMPRNLGTHPGGVVITPGPIERYTHTEISPLGWPVIAWEKDGAEDAGFVKIDLLGNRSLGVLRDCIAAVNQHYGTRISWERFDPTGNRAAERMIAAGDTLGVFYIESPATRQLLRKMGRGDYEHLLIASSIIRPAANRYIGEFVRRLRGGEYRRLPGAAGEVLEESYGIMVYQEDVSKIAAAVAGFSSADADGLRKVLSKKDRQRRLPAFRERFIAGGMERGYARSTLEELWAGILSFDGYSFCKAHSASYALLSYKLAWMKRHFPLIFMLQVINNGGGFYSRQVYLNEVRRRGYPLLPPRVAASALRCTADFERGGLRIGLGQIKELEEAAAERIIAERERGGPFAGAQDFFRRLRLDYPSLRALIRSGALDGLDDREAAGGEEGQERSDKQRGGAAGGEGNGEAAGGEGNGGAAGGALGDSQGRGYTRPQLFWLHFHRERAEGLFGPPPVPGIIGDYTPAQKLLDEYRFTGLIFSRHPLDIFLPRISRYQRGNPPLIDSRLLAARVGQRVRIAGMLVTEKEVRTASKREMAFVSFEDPYAIFEAVLFPEAYERQRFQLEDGGAFIAEGKVEREWGAVSLSVERLYPLSRPPEKRGEHAKRRACTGRTGQRQNAK
jgi:DNA polymerase III alpha subunit